MRDEEVTKDDWGKLFELLDTALELSPDAREPWLVQLDVSQALKDRLRQLLTERSRFAQDGFLETPAARPPASAAATRMDRPSRAPEVDPIPPSRPPGSTPGSPSRPAIEGLPVSGRPVVAPEPPTHQSPKKQKSKARPSSSVKPPPAAAPREPERPTAVRDLSVLPSRNADGAPHVGMMIKGRYTLTDELGQGGMGRVYKARDQRRVEAEDRQPYVALKVLSEDFKEHPDAFIALQREGKRAQELAHPNVITVHDFDRDGQLIFMTMEYLQGKALDVHMRTDFAAGLSVAAAWPIIRGIGAALEYGHSKKIIHCDMKPSNVFICRDGSVKVLDFGIARPMTGHDPEGQTTAFDPGKRLGGLTPAYASLEMWSREEPDPRDDIYAFACVTYQLLAGKHPFDGRSARVVRDERLTPKRIDSISRAQWDVLRKGLAVHRDARVATVAQFMAPFAPSTFVRRHGLTMSGAAAIVAVAGLVLAAHYFREWVEDRMIGGSSAPVVTPSDKTLTPEQKQLVAENLALAQELFASVKVTDSPDEMMSGLSEGAQNPYQIVEDVLRTDPSNSTALKLQTKIADLYSRKARQLVAKGDVKSAKMLVDAGLNVQPGHRGLFRLRVDLRELCSSNAAAC